MTIDHGTLVWLAQSVGLIYLIVLSIAVVVYACWPANRTRFDQAAKAILRDEDRP
jgi:cytochrome c oxidase cbb3-type subunit 4